MIELLTIEEVAERLRVPVQTVRWLRQEGRFAPAIRVGRRLIWDARDLTLALPRSLLWKRRPVDVRWPPLPSVVTVAHLVTQSLASRW